ncbi:hypothetical protein C5S29_00090 [ANME-1 cluster archaeon GoMg3.2]|nr:hypothetical protein [ANME-1 cluster archaeon GoMg3.2]
MSTLKHFPNDLALVIFLTLLCIPFVLIPPLNKTPVRSILGLPLVLFLPGYTLIAALFIRKDDLGGIERMALSVGLSIAISPLLGLALNYTPFVWNTINADTYRSVSIHNYTCYRCVGKKELDSRRR